MTKENILNYPSQHSFFKLLGEELVKLSEKTREGLGVSNGSGNNNPAVWECVQTILQDSMSQPGGKPSVYRQACAMLEETLSRWPTLKEQIKHLRYHLENNMKTLLCALLTGGSTDEVAGIMERAFMSIWVYELKQKGSISEDEANSMFRDWEEQIAA